MTNIKALITGPFSTGKTTLVQAVARELRKRNITVEIVPDVARSCPLPLNMDQTDDASIWLASRQLNNEIEATERGAKVVLCDRGIPDILAHHLDIKGRKETPIFDEMWNFLFRWISRYDIIFFSSIDDKILPENDGLRLADAVYRKNLEQNAYNILEKSNFVGLPVDTNSRIKECLSLLLGKL